MKILVLADNNSSHTYKWVTAIADKGIDIHIFSFTADTGMYEQFTNIEVTSMEVNNELISKNDGNSGKVSYLRSLPRLKKLIREYKPDILHAHYASSYGLLGALARFKPYILSVWGSDVYEFPNKSFIHKNILKYNLRKATKILSTSHDMARITKQYTKKPIEVIPFGIDCDVFKPIESGNNDLVIGTIKSLEPVYGIKYLIKAFSILDEKYSDKQLKLMLVGDGSQKDELISLTKELNISDKVMFTGKVPYEEVPSYHNKISIFVAVSERESFGVAVLESSACEIPVVVSNVGGLPEVVEDMVTGYVVEPKSPGKTAEAIEKLLLSDELRRKMGKAGRERVIREYEWKKNVDQMYNVYKNIAQ